MNSIASERQPGLSRDLPDVRMETTSESDNGRIERLRALISGGKHTLLFYTITALVVLAGWNRRGDIYLSPEDGLGYALGIIGGVMMLSLLLYPLRKHVRWARILGNVRIWFRTHMLLGVVGPVCILFHCNFQLGSMNGNIALFSMLLVASSGLVGRYFYTRIHYGLYGRKADLAHLGNDATTLRKCMDRVFAVAPELQERLGNLEYLTMKLPNSFIGSLVHVLSISFRSHWSGLVSAFRLRQALTVIAENENLDGNQLRALRISSRFYLATYLETIRRVAGLTFYERLFSLWHVLHLPLFVMLLLSGTVHVFAVHVY